MSGTITRLQGESFKDFTARQRAAQEEENRQRQAEINSARWTQAARRESRYHEWLTSDYNHDMDY